MARVSDTKNFLDNMLKNEEPHLISAPVLKEQRFSTNEGNYVPISKFYAGRSIFITGATGFMGQVS